MFLDPKRLIDRSIADLTQLSALLTAEIRDDASLRSPELRACEEAVATITTLILGFKLPAMRRSLRHARASVPIAMTSREEYSAFSGEALAAGVLPKTVDVRFVRLPICWI